MKENGIPFREITETDFESLKKVVDSISNISDILRNQNSILETLATDYTSLIKEVNNLKIRLKDSPYLAKVAGGIDEEIERLKRAKEYAGDTP